MQISRKVIPILALCFLSLITVQQANAGGFDWDRVVYGGTFGATVTGDYTEISASPEVGYMITDYYMAGLGPVYAYYKSTTIEANTYGGRVFNRFMFAEKFFASAEYVGVQDNIRYLDSGGKESSWQNSALAGGGIRYPLGNKSCSGIYASIMFDLLAPSPLANPVLNVSVVL